jgi:hypothetical protein
MATIAGDFDFIGSRVFAKLAAILVVRDLTLAGRMFAFSGGVCHRMFPFNVNAVDSSVATGRAFLFCS